MKKTITILLATMLLFAFISCNNEGNIDDAFNCTITFDGNGATKGEMATQTTGRGVGIKLNANTYERDKYLFAGWNTKADGSGTPYTDGQKIKVSGNTTLYAQWEIDAIILDSSMDIWTDGNVYILNSSITIGNRIEVSGSVTLILNDGCKLTASEGINVTEGNSITINASGEGTGILEATGHAGAAGIGSYNYHNSGTIIINGGTVNANTEDGAGIGGGSGGSGGTIIINGGIVTVSSKKGAGIGGGSGGSGGTIIINGGIVTVSSKQGAGIGGGNEGSGGSITINSGTVNANADNGGAGIGGGSNGSGGSITINGGTVTACSKSFDSSAGIGRGAGSGSDGTLTLADGVSLQVSHNNTDWSDYNGTTRNKYMKTV